MCSTVALLCFAVALTACCGLAVDNNDQQQGSAGCEGRCRPGMATGITPTATCKGAALRDCSSSSAGLYQLGPSLLQVQHRRSIAHEGHSDNGFKVVDEFEPTVVGANKVCRGRDEEDNLRSYFELEEGVASIEACKEKCISTPGCQGVEFGSYKGRCEIWTRPEGIGATKPFNGFTCIRYTLRTMSTTTATLPSTASIVTTTTFPEPRTTKGCRCRQTWILTGFPDNPCNDWCCNPDSDPNGFWCFVWDSNCQGQNWGYCEGPLPPTTPPPPTQPPPSFGDTQVLQIEWEHFQLVNQLRREGYTCPAGKIYPPIFEALKFECRLWRAAKGHSQDMADQNYFSHTSPDGSSPWERARAQGISANGENIAASCTTAECALEQWKRSDAHCHNLMDPSFKMFSVALGYNADSDWKFYWTQLFTAGEVIADTSCFPELTGASLLERKPADKPMNNPQAARPWSTGAVGTAGRSPQKPPLPMPWNNNETADKREPRLPLPWRTGALGPAKRRNPK